MRDFTELASLLLLWTYVAGPPHPIPRGGGRGKGGTVLLDILVCKDIQNTKARYHFGQDR